MDFVIKDHKTSRLKRKCESWKKCNYLTRHIYVRHKSGDLFKYVSWYLTEVTWTVCLIHKVLKRYELWNGMRKINSVRHQQTDKCFRSYPSSYIIACGHVVLCYWFILSTLLIGYSETFAVHKQSLLRNLTKRRETKKNARSRLPGYQIFDNPLGSY